MDSRKGELSILLVCRNKKCFDAEGKKEIDINQDLLTLEQTKKALRGDETSHEPRKHAILIRRMSAQTFGRQLTHMRNSLQKWPN